MITHKTLSVSIISVFIFLIMHSALFADKPRDAKHTFSYRGMRMSNADGLFYVTKIETEIEHSGIIEIEIKFNMPADPRTLQKKHISINGQFLPTDAVDALVAFNKAGDKMKLLIQDSFLSGGKDMPNRSFYIDLPEAKSFNHVPLYLSHFDDIERDKEYTFRFLNMPPQKPSKEMHEEMHTHNHHHYEYVRFEEKD